jgi:Xaa-Pro aminopeptidase
MDPRIRIRNTDCTVYYESHVKRENVLLWQVSPVTLMKAIKNSVELQGFEACHARDAAALCQYFPWLEKSIASGQITEISGADQLEIFRSELDNFVGQFFFILLFRFSLNRGIL